MALTIVDELIDIFKSESAKFKRDQEYLQRAPHLRPVFYRVLLTTRPFGLALCKTFEEKYLCVVLPESPSGQLGIYKNPCTLSPYMQLHTTHYHIGLIAGSEILSINSFAQKSEVISILNENYPHQKQHNFIWMYQFPKIQYLQDNTVMPITLYLKFDPLVVLSENTEKCLDKSTENNDDEKRQQQNDKNKEKEQCNYWKLLQDDIYRWAVTQKAEIWQVCEQCDVYTMPAIQSPIIEQNIIDYYHDKANKIIIKQQLNDNKNATNKLKKMSDFVVEDEYYQKIGVIEGGTKLKVYAKAGSYLQIREPMNGWVKFKNVGTSDYCIKCKEQSETEKKEELKENDKKLKVIGKGNGDFTLFVTKNYLDGIEIKPVLEKAEEKNESGNDAEYNIIEVVDGLNAKCGKERCTILYFMGDVDFGYTFDAQQKHLEKIMNLFKKFGGLANFVFIRVCCIDNNLKSKKAQERLKIGNEDIDGCVYGRSRIEILKTYGLLSYDTGFFKYGLMILSKNKEIVIHPGDNIDDDVFEKVATHIISNK